MWCCVCCVSLRCAYLSMVTRYFKSSLLINLTFERSQMRVRVIDLQTVHITSKNKQASKSLRNKTPFESPSNLFLSTFLSFVVYSVQSNLSLSLPLSTKYTLHTPAILLYALYLCCALSSVSQQQPICNRNEAKRILILYIGWAHV